MRFSQATAGRLAALLACAVTAAGCRLVTGVVTTDGMNGPPDGVEPRTVAPHTVQLEVCFVRCGEDDPELGEELWRFVDEQFLGDETRRRLNANGLRAGILSGHVPPELARRLVPDAEIADAVDPTLARRRLRLLPGRRSELVTAARRANLVLLEQCDDEVRGATYHDATALVSLEARPAADGRVRLEAVPEIRHGPVEKSWVGEDGMFRLETGQRRHRLDHLVIDVTLSPEAMLVIGCVGEVSTTVGDGLLRDPDRGGRATMRLLTIRPLARGTDPLFAAEEDAPPDTDLPSAGDR